MAQNPDSMAAWLQWMAQAMRGTQEAQKMFTTMAQSPEAIANFQKWLAVVAPNMEMPTAVSQPDALNQWIEEWQKTVGVVDRSRYLALLEKVDSLERRIKTLEEINRQLLAALEGREQQDETTQKMSDLWGQVMENTFKAQTAWLDEWAKADDPDEDANVTDDDSEE